MSRGVVTCCCAVLSLRRPPQKLLLRSFQGSAASLLSDTPEKLLSGGISGGCASLTACADPQIEHSTPLVRARARAREGRSSSEHRKFARLKECESSPRNPSFQASPGSGARTRTRTQSRTLSRKVVCRAVTPAQGFGDGLADTYQGSLAEAALHCVGKEQNCAALKFSSLVSILSASLFQYFINTEGAASRVNAGSAENACTFPAGVRVRFQRGVRKDACTFPAGVRVRFQRGTVTVTAGVKAREANEDHR